VKVTTLHRSDDRDSGIGRDGEFELETRIGSVHGDLFILASLYAHIIPSVAVAAVAGGNLSSHVSLVDPVIAMDGSSSTGFVHDAS